MAVGRERAAQLFPLALIAKHAPGLDQFRAGDFVGEIGCVVGQCPPPPSGATDDRTIRIAVPACHDPHRRSSIPGCETARAMITGCPAFAGLTRNEQ